MVMYVRKESIAFPGRQRDPAIWYRSQLLQTAWDGIMDSRSFAQVMPHSPNANS